MATKQMATKQKKPRKKIIGKWEKITRINVDILDEAFRKRSNNDITVDDLRGDYKTLKEILYLVPDEYKPKGVVVNEEYLNAIYHQLINLRKASGLSEGKRKGPVKESVTREDALHTFELCLVLEDMDQELVQRVIARAKEKLGLTD